MLHTKLKIDHPFASKFLESAMSEGNGKLASAYLLTGSNMLAMYFLALEAARILNCRENTADCFCSNCNWIRENRHPAVITISPIDYVHANKDGKAKTVITIDQSRHLKKELFISSQYHRIIIFMDAAEGKECEAEAIFKWKEYEGLFKPPAIENREEGRENWIPLPLDYKILHSEPANALLKIIEEPPPRVTFFFLARDREDMLQTIVSRSQAIPVNSVPTNNSENNLLEGFFRSFPPKTREEAILFSERLLEISKENSISVEDLLVNMEEYLASFIRNNSSDRILCLKNINFLKKVQKAKLELDSYVSPQSVLDSLLISFS